MGLSKIRGSVLTSLIFFLSGCAHNWNYQSLEAGYKDHSSSKLSYVEEEQGPLSLELIRYKEIDHLYLIVKQYQLIQGEENLLDICVKIDNVDHSFKAIRREGGQKILLPPEAKDLVVKNLLESKKVRITVGSFSLLANGEGFKKHYERTFSSSFLTF